MAVALQAANVAASREGKEVLLELVPPEALDLEAPDRIRHAIVGDLRKWNADFRDPPLRIDRRLRLPDRIPGEVEGDVIAPLRRDGIADGTAGGDAEEVAAEVIVTRVECDGDDVAVDGLVPPGEARSHLRGIGLEHPRPEVDGLAVDEDAHLRPLRRRLALLRVELCEPGHRLGAPPY